MARRFSFFTTSLSSDSHGLRTKPWLLGSAKRSPKSVAVDSTGGGLLFGRSSYSSSETTFRILDSVKCTSAVRNYSSPACGARTSRSFDLVYWRGRVQGAPVPQLLFSAQQPHHQLSTLLCGYAGGRTIFIGTALAQKSKVRFFSSFFPERPQYYTEPPSDKPPLPQHKVQKIVVRYENTPKYEHVEEVSESAETLLDVIQELQLPVEAACDGIAACSTCHCYLDSPSFGSLPNIEDHEEDMLELAANRRETSRLACQIMLHQFKFENGQRTTPAKNPGGSTESSAYGTRSKGKNTITITLPSKVNNLMDFIPFEDPK